MAGHEIFVEKNCDCCPLTIDNELGWCPIALIHLNYRDDLSDEAEQALFGDGECATRKVIEKNTTRKALPRQKTLPLI